MNKLRMKKKAGFFSEKICITASSQDLAHRPPVSFIAHRGVVIISAVLLLCVVAFCTFIAVNALLTMKELTGVTDELQSRIELQSSELAQYEQQISELQSTQ